MPQVIIDEFGFRDHPGQPPARPVPPYADPVLVEAGGVFWNLYGKGLECQVEITGTWVTQCGTQLDKSVLDRLRNVRCRMSLTTATRLGLVLDGSRTIVVDGTRHRVARTPADPGEQPEQRPDDQTEPGRP